MPIRFATDEKIKVGEFTLTYWDDPDNRDTVYVEKANGEGGSFPLRDIKKLLSQKDTAKKLRRYYDENF